MASVDKKLAFARRHVTDPKGKLFDDTPPERAWIRDFWSAIDGYKAWPVSQTNTCPECQARVGEIFEFPWDLDDTRTAEHREELHGCEGLELRKVHYVLFSAPRRGGKTFNIGAYVAPTMFLETWQHIRFFATGEDHSKELDRDNFRGVVERNKRLLKRAVLKEAGYLVPKMNNQFSVSATVTRRAIGGSANLYIVDECREVDGSVVTAALPQILDVHGTKCDSCAYRAAGKAEEGACPQCPTGRLVPYYGAAVLMSSAGRIDDGKPATTWFQELVTELRKQPDPAWHLIDVKDAADINPDVQEEAKSGAVRVLSRVSSLAPHVDIEYHNKAQRIGHKVFAEHEIKACVNRDLSNAERCDKLCIGFLDASRVSDLTSLVIVEDTGPEGAEFLSWRMVRVDMFDPKGKDGHGRPLFPRGITQEIVRPHLDFIVPAFAPTLVGLWIDVRNIKRVQWAKDMYEDIKRDKSCTYRRQVREFTGGGRERDLGWGELERYIRGGLCEFMPIDRLIKELCDAEWKLYKGSYQIRETNNRKLHLELSESLAAICCILTDKAARRKRGRSMGARTDRTAARERRRKELRRNRGIY